MVKIIVLVCIVAAAYFYWQGPDQQRSGGDSEQQYEENAQVMKRCMRQERSIAVPPGRTAISRADRSTDQVPVSFPHMAPAMQDRPRSDMGNPKGM